MNAIRPTEAIPGRLIYPRTPSLGEKIQHGCLICLGSEQPSCFSCLIILGCNFPKIWATAQNFWSGYKKMPNFIILPNIMGFEHGAWSIFLIRQLKGYVGFWDVKSVSLQATYYMEWRSPPSSIVSTESDFRPYHLVNSRLWTAINQNPHLSNVSFHLNHEMMCVHTYTVKTHPTSIRYPITPLRSASSVVSTESDFALLALPEQWFVYFIGHSTDL